MGLGEAKSIPCVLSMFVRVACLISGGKDGIWADWVIRNRGWTVTHYVTLIPEEDDPLLYHRPNVEWVRLQAQCANVQHVTGPAAAGDEAELEALHAVLDPLDVDGVVSGALASEYQRTRIEHVCHDLGLKSFTPLWHHDASMHVRNVVAGGVEAVFSRVAAQGLDKSWLGRRLNEQAAADLDQARARYGVDLAGEGGEYETFVLDAPQFHQRINVDEAEATWHRDSGTYHIRRARLAFKQERTISIA